MPTGLCPACALTTLALCFAAACGGSEDNETGAQGGDVPPTVTEFGCFAASGDGLDFLADGSPAFPLGNTTCDGQKVSDNAGAFAAETPPSTFSMTREFVLTEEIVGGAVTIAFGADDAAEFVLNGNPVASCTPPDGGNIGECSQTCHTVTIPRDALLGAGELNKLEITVTNLLSIDAGGGNFGYTSVWYSVCAVQT